MDEGGGLGRVMDRSLEEFERLVDAEDFLQFFGIPYDRQVVQVNRLHILKKFALMKEAIDQQYSHEDPECRLLLLREAMQRAYETFLTSTAAEQRLFKLFQQPPPRVVVIKTGDIHHHGNGA